VYPKKFEQQQWSLFVALVLSTVFCLASFLIAGAARADETVSLKNWPFENAGAYQLKDGWQVYRGTFVEPISLYGAACGSASAGNVPAAISAPDIWGPGITTTVTSGHGTATYCVDVELPDAENFYSLRMGALRSVSHIYAVFQDWDGEVRTLLLDQNGPLNNEAEQIVNNPAVPIINLPHSMRKFTLVMQLSNRIHKQGGMVEVPKLDLKWRMAAEDNRATAMPSALVIVLLLTALAALILGQRGEHAGLHRVFAFMAAAAAMRAAFVSDLVWDYFPAFSLARKYDLEYLSLYVIAIGYYAFVLKLLRPGRLLKIDYIIYGLTGGLAVFAIFIAPFFVPGTITLTREPIMVIWSAIILMVAYSVFQTTINVPEKRREAITVASAAVVYAAYELASANGLIGASLEWSQFIIFLVVMIHAQAFVAKSRRTERERDELMARLEDTNRDLQNRALALDLALKRAEEASKAKSNFLATFSHELRTPLNAIIGFSELMNREVFGELGSSHYKEYVNDINSSGTHLLALVDDILDLSRIEAGADDVNSKDIDIPALIDDVLNILHVMAKQKNIRMAQNAALKVPMIHGDERKIKQVMINLVTNAIKFNNDKGRIDVNVHADETGLYVDVVDTGIGIAENDIPIVLSRFGQADSSKKPENSGVGIGLPLSEVLMRQHGGKLKVTSKLGEGTCVGLWFPPSRVIQEETGEMAEAG
jgi:signal transduction histidine kinase